MGGPSGMRAEDLKGWIREATRKKESVGRRWDLLVRLLQKISREGTPLEELTWAKMFLIPKGEG